MSIIYIYILFQWSLLQNSKVQQPIRTLYIYTCDDVAANFEEEIGDEIEFFRNEVIFCTLTNFMN